VSNVEAICNPLIQCRFLRSLGVPPERPKRRR